MVKTIEELMKRDDRFSDAWWKDFERERKEPAGAFGPSVGVMSAYTVRHIVMQLIEELEDARTESR